MHACLMIVQRRALTNQGPLVKNLMRNRVIQFGISLLRIVPLSVAVIGLGLADAGTCQSNHACLL